MASTPQHDNTSSHQAWKLIEQDYTLRLSLVASGWAEAHLKAWNAVFAEGRRRNNAGYCGPALVEMEIEDADKRAEWAYKTCCEIWDIQGRAKGRPFFRAVFDGCLQPMFSVREGCFKSQLALYRSRNNNSISQDQSAIGGHMKREMDKLRAKWNTKLEIATRNSDYQQQQAGDKTKGDVLLPSSVSLAPTQNKNLERSTFTWKELENRFGEIQSKAPVKQKVEAWFTLTESHSGAVTEEWRVMGNPACRVEFEKLASIASRKLGYIASENATEYWLGRVREWMQRERLDKSRELAWLPTGYSDFEGHRDTMKGLWTDRIAELSAMFCMELIAGGTPESMASTPSERAEASVASERAKTNRAGKRLTRAEMRKRQVIFGAIQANLKGKKYCSELDSKRLPIPLEWKERNCPDSYAGAYRDRHWRQRIQDQKTTYRRKFDATPAIQREDIIQGIDSTRHTRH